MKKALSIILILTFCLSLVACGKNLAAVEEAIQGNWVRAEETQSSSRVLLSFNNGEVSRREIIGETTKTMAGVYTINSDGEVVIAYTDGSSQKFLCYAGINGPYLVDFNSGVQYNKEG